ncbi:alpha/beta hydrolase family protein [Halobiforma nitratireducens]|nr:alpha/beta hydrolase [Halobiforma nitratireducens]
MSETHSVPVVDGESVVAVRHRPEPTSTSGAAGKRPWFVCCHGFVSDKSGSYERRCRRAVAEGYDAVRFDFRGCGESDGRFVDATLSSRLADLAAVLEYFDPPSVALFGSSFGAKVAVHVAAGDTGPRELDRKRIEAVVARAPVTYARAFDDYRTVVDRRGEYLFDENASGGDEGGQSTSGTDGDTGNGSRRIDARFFDDLDAYSFADAATDLTVPVLIVHGREDESVSVADSFEAASRLETDVTVRAIPGEGHRFSTGAEARLLDQAFDWLERVPFESSGRS